MKRALSAACLLAAALAAYVTPASAQSGYFSFTVCNRSAHDADVATHGLIGGAWVVQGWFTVYRGQCRYIGSYGQGAFDTFAIGRYRDVYWDGVNNGGTLNLCLAYPGPFRRVNTAGYTCRSNEKLHLMRTHHVTSGSFTWSLN